MDGLIGDNVCAREVIAETICEAVGLECIENHFLSTLGELGADRNCVQEIKKELEQLLDISFDDAYLDITEETTVADLSDETERLRELPPCKR